MCGKFSKVLWPGLFVLRYCAFPVLNISTSFSQRSSKRIDLHTNRTGQNMDSGVSVSPSEMFPAAQSLSIHNP